MILQAEIWTIMVIQHSKDKDSKYRKYSRKKKLIHLVLARNKFTAETHRNSPELRNELKYPGIFFFFTAGVSDASELRRNRVGETKKKKKKKKKRTLAGHWNPAVVPVPVSDTCPTSTRRQKWSVRAT